MGTSWNLNSKDISLYGGSSTTSIRKNNRQDRSIDLKGAEINLVHKPTKLEVKGIIPKGNYSKKEMVQLKDSLYKSLFIELENKVAKHLKIPKR